MISPLRWSQPEIDGDPKLLGFGRSALTGWSQPEIDGDPKHGI